MTKKVAAKPKQKKRSPNTKKEHVAKRALIKQRTKHSELITPSTSSTAGTGFVESEEGTTKKPEFGWVMENGIGRNCHELGRLLASTGLPLFQHPDGGLLFIDNGEPLRIGTAKEFAPLLIDTVRIHVLKNGKFHGERLNTTVLSNMLSSQTFLGNFRKVEVVVRSPILLTSFNPSHPGFNDTGVLQLGSPATPAKTTRTVEKFLSVMEWETNADRTNAVAALLTVPMRHQFAGGKPLILITASKSHAGKGTLVDFIRAGTPKAELLYENIDWPMAKSLHEQIQQFPDIGVINIDNVRIDSAGRGRLIRSGFLESMITNSEIITNSVSTRPIRIKNNYLVLLNTNEGSLSIDLLNRSLPIRLSPTGDLHERIARAKTALGGDVKHEWLPTHQHQMQSELWGMIERWRSAGMPLDESVKHPMGPWAKTVGGILLANGFTDFLGNYAAMRVTADPIREAIGILAFHSGTKPQRSADLASKAVCQGLDRVLMPNAKPSNLAECARAIGVMLSPYVGETFVANTATERITYRLYKRQGRFDQTAPHFRYWFEEISREKATAEGGVVLEESPTKSGAASMLSIPELKSFKPETL